MSAEVTSRARAVRVSTAESEIESREAARIHHLRTRTIAAYQREAGRHGVIERRRRHRYIGRCCIRTMQKRRIGKFNNRRCRRCGSENLAYKYSSYEDWC
ncbi:unnamed protein product [Trichogramma brassicae]|uniref:Uncharacterized protein n=1 Tax=Trichogramma brassicae TaxID=86971 RepID=A0A6H5IMV7_9HYME|nr:unnamed protein product [Trichogramma brassicae]